MAQDSLPQLSIRRTIKEEWRELRDLRLRALRTDPLAFDWTLDEELSFPDARWQETATKGAESLGSSTWVTVDPTGRLVGMVGVFEANGIPNVSKMWLDPAYRGRGAAGRLLDTALAWARATHPRAAIRLELNPKQIAATALYESRGFRFTGSKRPPRVPRDVEIEAHEMVLQAADESKA
jgi:GNAT superfamily N-acetyltransferase